MAAAVLQQEEKNKELGVDLPDPVAATRTGALLPAPPNPRYRIAVVGFLAPGGPALNSDKNRSAFACSLPPRRPRTPPPADGACG